MKKTEVLKSNFITFLSLLIGTILLGLFSEFQDYFLDSDKEILSVFQIGILGSIFSFFTYGIIVWPLILILNLFIETFGTNRIIEMKNLKKVFFYETILIIGFSTIISFNNQYYYWFLLIPIYSISQYFRFKYLKRDFYNSLSL